MGMFSFIKEAGEKLFGRGEAQAAQPTAAAATPEEVSALSKTAGDAIAAYVNKMGLKVDALQVSFDAPSATVTVAGVAPDQATKEKVLLCCGNVASVAAVKDMMTVADSGTAESQMYVVVSGDNLSKISKQFYGTPNKYTQIFEANKPMLSDPDKIYPGQVLRIPPDAA